MPRILCLSNGHGEDQVASRILAELLSLGVEVIALPVVGEGKAYQALGVPLLDATLPMPSGGFIYQDWRQFWRDVRGGLLGLTLRQLQKIRQPGSKTDLVLAVGDIVVLLMAWWSGANFAFVGTAKSDYYWRNEHGSYRQDWLSRRQLSDYLPWERWLMARRRCLAVFPRDTLTASGLKAQGLPVFDLGNPMMDGLDAQDSSPLLPDPGQPALLILPGSRPPEAYENWQRILPIVQALPPEIAVYAATTANLSSDHLSSGGRIRLIQGHFAACAQRADVVLAMAGTATEQCVGLGKPVVTLPGSGPQFTPAFAEAQTRLLGASIYLTDPASASEVIQRLFGQLQTDPRFRAQLQDQGRQRLGSPGAGQRIAQQLHQFLSPVDRNS